MSNDKTSETPIEVVRSSGNVFADFGVANAEEELAKAKLEFSIRQRIKASGLNQTDTTTLLGTDQAKILPEEQEPQVPSARQLLALPKEERTRILQAQAERAAAEYETDLAHPVADRELTAFTALDGEEFYDYPKESAPYT